MNTFLPIGLPKSLILTLNRWKAKTGKRTDVLIQAALDKFLAKTDAQIRQDLDLIRLLSGNELLRPYRDKALSKRNRITTRTISISLDSQAKLFSLAKRMNIRYTVLVRAAVVLTYRHGYRS